MAILRILVQLSNEKVISNECILSKKLPRMIGSTMRDNFWQEGELIPNQGAGLPIGRILQTLQLYASPSVENIDTWAIFHPRGDVARFVWDEKGKRRNINQERLSKKNDNLHITFNGSYLWNWKMFILEFKRSNLSTNWRCQSSKY